MRLQFSKELKQEKARLRRESKKGSWELLQVKRVQLESVEPDSKYQMCEVNDQIRIHVNNLLNTDE